MKNLSIKLVSRPIGVPTDACWLLEEKNVSELADNQILVKVQYLSIDPAMRGWMNEGKSYIRPVKIG